MAELRRRRPKMSEVEFVDKKHDENSGKMSEITETTHELVEETEGLGEEDSLLTLEPQTEDKTSLELPSVDVTVEGKDTENEEENVSSEETDALGEEDQERATLIEKCKEVCDDDDSAEVDKVDDEEQDDDDNIEDETVTCSLLGLEQAKVNSFLFVPLKM